jgi:hypothetical protein
VELGSHKGRRALRNCRRAGETEVGEGGLRWSGVRNEHAWLGTRLLHNRFFRENWRAYRFDVPMCYVAVPDSFDNAQKLRSDERRGELMLGAGGTPKLT